MHIICEPFLVGAFLLGALPFGNYKCYMLPLCVSCVQLERLQAENISEWDKREILETEKQGLEKENRRLKAQVKEMEELLDGKNRFSANSQGPDFKTSQIEPQGQKKVWVLLGSNVLTHCTCLPEAWQMLPSLLPTSKPEYFLLCYLTSGLLLSFSL